MLNFEYYNPVRVVFGKGAIARLSELAPVGTPILLVYGGGSIKANGVYAQVMEALQGRPVVEFPGVEPNPLYETCLRAVARAKEAGAGFLLAVGGGSTLDATKFIAAAAMFPGDEPWDILAKAAPVAAALPLGCVMTLPATGSEVNCYSVISRAGTGEKLFFGSPEVFPRFSILDPETTFSLPPRQTANGIVDAFVHVTEQYLTYEANAPLQDRQSEAILLTLMQEAPKVLASPADYDARATVMWAASNALNGLAACGVPQDWATHMIGHELTAMHGIDHAVTLAIVLPRLLERRKLPKLSKLVQFGRRVLGLSGSRPEIADAAIRGIEDFFRSLGVKTRLAEHGVSPSEAAAEVSRRLAARNAMLGECMDISPDEAGEIVSRC